MILAPDLDVEYTLAQAAIGAGAAPLDVIQPLDRIAISRRRKGVRSGSPGASYRVV